MIEKAKNDGIPSFEKFIKTLDNRKILIKNDGDSDCDFDEQQRLKSHEERVQVNNPVLRNKK